MAWIKIDNMYINMDNIYKIKAINKYNNIIVVGANGDKISLSIKPEDVNHLFSSFERCISEEWHLLDLTDVAKVITL